MKAQWTIKYAILNMAFVAMTRLPHYKEIR